ncbi:MAG: HAD-IA family hydrolase [Clostridia bacterium]|nr:HAD-IA family hydrolase [Clostridia bacterium]
MIKYVLFDLDGTLLSTLPTITYHLNGALSAHGLGKITVENTREYIGNGARKLVTRAVNRCGVDDEAVISAVLSDYNRAYDADPLPKTEPYDGITALVDRLHAEGFKLGVVTNKPEPTAKKLISHFFKDKISIVSGGREGIVLKPDPTESLSVLADMGGVPSECAFVGDTSVDILTGKNMGAALSIGVTWGFRSREELLCAGADVTVDDAESLYASLKGERL